MKRHVSKPEMKARLARREERFRESAYMRRKKYWGRPYRTPKQLKFQRWVCGIVQVCRKLAREGSRVARLERKHIDRVAKGEYIRWEDAFERGRAR